MLFNLTETIKQNMAARNAILLYDSGNRPPSGVKRYHHGNPGGLCSCLSSQANSDKIPIMLKQAAD